MNCIAMESVTPKFKEYDLSAIGEEYRKAVGPGVIQESLPQRIGVSKVHLLIGIKNARLTSTMERILDS